MENYLKLDVTKFASISNRTAEELKCIYEDMDIKKDPCIIKYKDTCYLSVADIIRILMNDFNWEMEDACEGLYLFTSGVYNDEIEKLLKVGRVNIFPENKKVRIYLSDYGVEKLRIACKESSSRILSKVTKFVVGKQFELDYKHFIGVSEEMLNRIAANRIFLYEYSHIGDWDYDPIEDLCVIEYNNKKHVPIQEVLRVVLGDINIDSAYIENNAIHFIKGYISSEDYEILSSIGEVSASSGDGVMYISVCSWNCDKLISYLNI
jgi:hypothetical protein